MKLVKKTALLLVLVLCFSCSKEEQTTSITSDNDFNVFGMRSNGKLLEFKTIEDYEKAIKTPSEVLKNQILGEVAKMPHITLAKFNPNMELNLNNIESYIDPYFSQLINKDNCIQIGAHIFRINKLEKKVLVLETKYASEYQDLVNENTSNAHIKIYSTEDDVLELVLNGEASVAKIGCNEDAAAGRTENVGIHTATGRDIFLFSVYDKLGIYCTAYYYMYSNATFSMSQRGFLQTENTWTKAKCEDPSVASSLPLYFSPGHSGSTKYLLVYSDTKRLNGYHLKGKIRYESGFAAPVFSNWAEIEANSPY